MFYLKTISAFVTPLALMWANASVNAETLYTRLECEAMDGATHVWVHSQIIEFDNGKPATDYSQNFDSGAMAEDIMADIFGETTKTVIVEHAEPFRKTLAEKYSLSCYTDIVTSSSVTTIEAFDELNTTFDPITVDLRKDFFNVKLVIRVIDYPEK